MKLNFNRTIVLGTIGGISIGAILIGLRLWSKMPTDEMCRKKQPLPMGVTLESCKAETTDAGKPCNSAEECEGVCVSETGCHGGQGKCSDKTNPCLYNFTIENGICIGSYC